MKKVSALSVAMVALAMSSAPASAAVLIGAKTIKITSAVSNFLQVAEVIATQFSTGVDVALTANGGTASAVSSYQAAHGGVSTPVAAALAINGVNVAGYPQAYVSNTAGPTEALTIRLAAPANLSGLTIYGRASATDFAYVARDVYNVSVFNAANSVIWSGTMSAYANYLAHGSNTNFDFATQSFPGSVPEPTGWMMMIAGFGLVGAVLRRRNQTVRVAYG